MKTRRQNDTNANTDRDTGRDIDSDRQRQSEWQRQHRESCKRASAGGTKLTHAHARYLHVSSWVKLIV
eukprot:13505712-Alexandrium_andersonii.AAC.1